MRECRETQIKEKMIEFSRRFEKFVALKKDEAPYDVKVKNGNK